MSEVKGRCLPLRAGPDSVFLVIVSALQIANTAWRFHLEIQAHLVVEGTPAGPSQGTSGALGQNNAITQFWEKQAGLRTGKGAGVYGVQGPEKAPHHGECAHPALRP